MHTKAEYITKKDLESHSPFLGCFRSYCELDLIEMRRIQEYIKNRNVIKQIDVDSIYSNLQGQSLFSFFEGKPILYERILKVLQEKGYENKEDYDEDEVEPPNLRRIVQILTQKSQINLAQSQENEEDKSFIVSSVLQRSFSEVKVRDLLLEIANLCPNFSLFEVVRNLNDVSKILKKTTPIILDLLDSCAVETKSTRLVNTIEYLPNL